MAARRQAAGTGCVGVLPAVAREHIDARQVAALGYFDFLVGRQARVLAGLDLRVVFNRALNGLGQGHGVGGGAAHGERDAAADKVRTAHEISLLESCLIPVAN